MAMQGCRGEGGMVVLLGSHRTLWTAFYISSGQERFLLVVWGVLVTFLVFSIWGYKLQEGQFYQEH